MDRRGKDPDVSPDGSRVVFTRLSADDRWLGLWVAALDGSDAVRIAESPANGDFDPAWSPDGSAIVFSRNREGHAELFTVSADGTNLQPLTTNSVGQDLFPSWSPDGSAIVFARNSGGSIDLWTVDVADGEPTQLTHFEDGNGGAPSYPSWSPDRLRIAFVAAAPDQVATERGALTPRDVWTIQVGGSDLTRITATPNDEAKPAWSPDATSLVFLQSVEANPSGLSIDAAYRPALLELASGTSTTLEAPLGNLVELSLQWVGEGPYLRIPSSSSSGHRSTPLADLSQTNASSPGITQS